MKIKTNPEWLMRQAPNDIESQATILIAKGYIIEQRTKNSLLLKKKKKFSIFWAIMWTFVVGFGLIVYLLFYSIKQDKYIELKATPKVMTKPVTKEVKNPV